MSLWVSALNLFLKVHSSKEFDSIDTVFIDYDYVRRAGERLKTFGGTASGAEPLREMFQIIETVIKGKEDPFLDLPVEVEPGYNKMRPVHVLSMGNCIGYNVVVGGVRRTAEIFLMSPEDWESILAKYGINGIWDVENHKKVIDKLRDLGQESWAKKLETMKPLSPDVRPLHHRRMSNNSIAFTRKPKKKELNLVFTLMKGEGEPGFVNLRQLAERRFKAMGVEPTERMVQELTEQIGMNPCAEIDLANKGVCNLTTVNVTAFVYKLMGTNVLDLDALLEAQRMSARIGLRMTLVNLELKQWNRVQKKDRLLGCSLTGWKDAMDQLGYDSKKEEYLLKLLGETARKEADRFAKELRINSPLLVTTIKPEGTLSQVANGVSSGLHMSHSPYYIRRIRINAQDPLAKAVKNLGWVVNPEIGTPGRNFDEKMKNARTLVIDFPVYSGAKRTKNDISVEEQFETYFRFQENYTEHNSSNTITIKAEEGEWEKAEEIVWSNWDNFTAVSFLALDGGSYDLAPYEEITKEQYENLLYMMPEFDMDVLRKFENQTGEEVAAGDPG